MAEESPTAAFGRFLRFWRQVRGLSQEELAERLKRSNRHITRVESGSGHPSEGLLEDIADVLQLGERDRNHLRLSAGYAPAVSVGDFGDPEFDWLRDTSLRTLRALDPWPTLVFDILGEIRMVNRGWVALFADLLPRDEFAALTNQWDFVFERAGPGSENSLSMMLMGLKHFALFRHGEAENALVERLSAYPRLPGDWAARASRFEPRCGYPLTLELGGIEHGFQCTITISSAPGPTAYFAEPYLVICTLYPEQGAPPPDQLNAADLRHPLLLY